MNIYDMRNHYNFSELRDADVPKNPLELFAGWFEDARKSNIKDANAMSLATVSDDGVPSNRIVLLKDFDEKGFVFFTNYESRKAKEMLVNPSVAVSFFWNVLERQVSIMGEVEKVSRKETEEYFATRPRESQIGAWASHQSSILQNRTQLESQYNELKTKFGDGAIPVPSHWGGYVIHPKEINFWQGRPSRLHDRFQYILKHGVWKVNRISP